MPALDPPRFLVPISVLQPLQSPQCRLTADCNAMCPNHDDIGRTAGALEVKAGSHSAHEEYWDRVSQLTADRKAGIGDWYLFKPEARAQRPTSSHTMTQNHAAGC